MRLLPLHAAIAAVAAATLTSAATPAAAPAAAPAGDGWAVTPPAGSVVAVHTGRPNTTVLGTLTSTAARGRGHLTAYTCGASRPGTSNVAVTPDAAHTNFVAVKTDAAGDFCVYTSTAGHVVFDLAGTARGFTAAAPLRVADSRSLGAVLRPGTVLHINAGVPAGVTTAGTLTVTGATAAGHTVAWSCDGPRPAASTSNFAAGETVANFVAVKANSRGQFCVYTTAGAHLIYDQTITTTRLPVDDPTRLLDTRSSARPGAGTTTVVHTGAAGRTVYGNLTVTGAAAAGRAVAWPCNQPRPAVTSATYPAGRAQATFTAAATSPTGDLCLWTSQPAHLIFDRAGTSDTVTADPGTRLLDTRTLDMPLHPGTGQPFPAKVARWTGTVAAALDDQGLPRDYLPGILAQIQQESSGNPDAVNGWDSNWRDGHASYGLMQLIAGTFQTYARPGDAGTLTYRTVNGVRTAYVEGMCDPTANVWAGINYASHRYGPGIFAQWNTGTNPGY